MAQLKLDAKVSNIVRFERNTGTSLMKAFTQDNLSITVIVELLKALSNATDKEIDEYVEEVGLEGATTAMMEALTTSGFLPKTEAPTQDQ